MPPRRGERAGIEVASHGTANEWVVAAERFPQAGDFFDGLPRSVAGQIDRGIGSDHGSIEQPGRRRSHAVVGDRVAEALPGESECSE